MSSVPYLLDRLGHIQSRLIDVGNLLGATTANLIGVPVPSAPPTSPMKDSIRQNPDSFVEKMDLIIGDFNDRLSDIERSLTRLHEFVTPSDRGERSR